MKINMPVPRPEDVARFKRIILETQGIELSDQEALNQCSNLVQYVFLTQFALPALNEFERRRKEDGTG